ncbi:MAG: hypothetical protein BJG00_015455 [Limnothrix sp. CACIAM 69d]|nr:MAG: hypothetical protein BJG00_015455 [Limnothrix sp. CACIAM 69d]
MSNKNRLVVSTDRIAQLRVELAEYPTALEALAEIEDCEGDLEDAAIALAIRAGQQPDRSDGWLEGLAKRCRARLCVQEPVRQSLAQGAIAATLGYLDDQPPCPAVLLLPVVLWVSHQGVETFCRPLDRPNLPES